jgi:aquaporin Z
VRVAPEQITNYNNGAVNFPMRPLADRAGIGEAVASHWPEYLMEGLELALFMLAACVVATLLFYTGSPILHQVPSATGRLVLMGLAMGVTAIAIILSPMGRRSGAHFNPAVSITYLFLGRMHWLDTLFYVIAQFIGGAFGVAVAWMLIGFPLGSPSVRYVVTVPGRYGVWAAFLAEVFMGFLLMTFVLLSGSSARLARYTWLLVGLLVAMYVIVFSAVSGFGLNPARTFSSALFAGVWTAVWIYLSAPLLGMLMGAGCFVTVAGMDKVYCGKIYHDLDSTCPFRCRFQQLLEPHQRMSTARETGVK